MKPAEDQRQVKSSQLLRTGWVLTTVGEIAEVIRGASPRPKGDPKYFGGSIPWIMISDITREPGMYLSKTKDTVTEEGAKRSRYLKAGTLILSNSATVCVPKILKVAGCIHDGFVAFPDISQNVDIKYLYYWFEAIRSRVVQENRQGITQVNLNTAIVRNIELPIAPLPEQQQIVDEIEKHFSRLDPAVDALKRVRANLKRYRAAVLKAASEGRLVPTEGELARAEGREYEPADVLLQRILRARSAMWETARLERKGANGRTTKEEKQKATHKEPPQLVMGRHEKLPEGWVSCTIGQAFHVSVGATPSRARAEYWNGDIPWVSSGEVAFCRIRATRETITELGLENTSTMIHPEGTVLLGMIGEGKTRGQSAILEIPACNNQNSAAIRVSQAGLPPEYIYRFLEGEYDRTRTLGSGNNQPALNKTRVEEIAFPLPPLAEQYRIVAEVERRLSIIEELEALVAANLKRATRLHQSILKRAFEGKLVPQDPNDEPASVLLERIRAERKATGERDASRDGGNSTKKKQP